jgi:hypothetical protein
MCDVFRSQGLVVGYLTSTCRMMGGHQLLDYNIHGMAYDLIVVR